ncbi:MAG TPA: sigma-70 family RNA polymerase sigma factor [Gemmataceae bacterium]|nr:sigma-70 family RNA polymerase sigma factor [Gemmataceae bacterium]
MTVNRNGLQAVLRSVVGAFAQVPDAELLRRYVADRDEPAFSELVRRHGRLVWSVCRQLTNCDADADDAFQATFLVLVNSAGKVRDASKLSAWLHGVAYKVCAKSRRAAKSRVGRETATAKGEGGTVVPDSAWDKALAAVHEEVARLPESLRVPFVLCCLEGKGATEAAEQLGWKLGTFSGRLTRAKDAIVARLHKRGMTLAAVVAVAAPRDAPAAVMKKASVLCGRDFAVPGSILKLSQGVLGMSASRVKLLAVGLFAVCGLGVGGSGWLSTAEAQSDPKPKVTASSQDKIKQLEEEIARLKQEAARIEKPVRVVPLTTPVPPTPAVVVKPLQPTPPQPPKVAAVREMLVERSAASGEYDYVLASEMTTAKFTTFLRDREAKGWEYKGEATLQHEGKAAPHWVFRKSAKKDVIVLGDAVRAAGAADHLLKDKLKLTEEVARATETARAAAQKERATAEGKLADAARALSARKVEDLKGEQLRALEVELKKLHDLRGTVVKPAGSGTTVSLKTENATTIAEQMKALAAVGGAKAKGAGLTVAADPKTNTVIITGPADAVKWAVDVIKSLDSK